MNFIQIDWYSVYVCEYVFACACVCLCDQHVCLHVHRVYCRSTANDSMQDFKQRKPIMKPNLMHICIMF